MDAWIAGIMALAGVGLGAWLNDFLSARRERKANRERDLRSALTAVIRARILARFPTSAGGHDAPRQLPNEDLDAFENRTYLESTERYFNALAEARQQVAGLAQYGMNVDAWVEASDFMTSSLPDIEAAVRAELRR